MYEKNQKHEVIKNCLAIFAFMHMLMALPSDKLLITRL